jgi:hypothetical protein
VFIGSRLPQRLRVISGALRGMTSTVFDLDLIFPIRTRARMPVWQTTVRRCPATAPVEESSVSPDRCCPTIIGAHSLCP